MKFCGVLAVFGALVSRADVARIDYRDGLLSVALESVSLIWALEETTQVTGVVFSIYSLEEKTISRQFENVPLEEGIRQLLAGYNYIMLFGEAAGAGRRVERVTILGESSDRPATSRVARRPLAAPVAGAMRPGTASSRELTLKRHPSGHYLSPGRINHVPVDFLVDTGATVVAVSDELARRLNLRIGPQRMVETANGRTLGYETVLASVALGSLRKEQVPAVILPDMQTGGRVLLGMSFLESFELVQRDGRLVVREHPGSGD